MEYKVGDLTSGGKKNRRSEHGLLVCMFRCIHSRRIESLVIYKSVQQNKLQKNITIVHTKMTTVIQA